MNINILLKRISWESSAVNINNLYISWLSLFKVQFTMNNPTNRLLEKNLLRKLFT